jgi:hypothetical protein
MAMQGGGIMRKGVLFTLAALSLCAVAYAGGPTTNNQNIGCGWGTYLFGDKDTKIPQILGATTNGTFGNQTFGISSETMGCTTKGGWVKNERRAAVYAEVNLQKLSKEMAQGGGEYLSAFATLMGCPDQAAKQAFFKVTQKNYESIFTSASIDSETMLRNLRTVMAEDPTLATL